VEMFCFVALTNLTTPYIVMDMMENVLVVEESSQTIHRLLNALMSRVVGERQELEPQRGCVRQRNLSSKQQQLFMGTILPLPLPLAA
jgi:hypothetical protein